MHVCTHTQVDAHARARTRGSSLIKVYLENEHGRNDKWNIVNSTRTISRRNGPIRQQSLTRPLSLRSRLTKKYVVYKAVRRWVARPGNMFVVGRGIVSGRGWQRDAPRRDTSIHGMNCGHINPHPRVWRASNSLLHRQIALIIMFKITKEGVCCYLMSYSASSGTKECCYAFLRILTLLLFWLWRVSQEITLSELPSCT